MDLSPDPESREPRPRPLELSDPRPCEGVGEVEGGVLLLGVVEGVEAGVVSEEGVVVVVPRPAPLPTPLPRPLSAFSRDLLSGL